MEKQTTRGPGRPPNEKYTVEELEAKFEEYKQSCDSRTVTRTEFSQKLGEFCTAEVPASVTCTRKGFLLYAGIPSTTFDRVYGKDEEYREFVTRMHDECEQDAREKLELGLIPTRLAGLWMSKYDGYSLRQETTVHGNVPVVIAGEDALED